MVSGKLFRCTMCQGLIPWHVENQELGLGFEEEPRPGATYPYEKCTCGWGKFVVCEVSGGKVSGEITTVAIEAFSGTRVKVMNAHYQELPVGQIRPNPYQPRKFFDAEALQSLAESIKTIGLLEDILVRPNGNFYEIVLGERRWRACQLAEISTVRAKVVDLDDEEAQRISLTENIHRENLTAVEEAFAFKGYIDAGQQLSEVGKYLGHIGDRVAERLKVLNTHYYIQYQEERIKGLQEMVERLRALRQNDYQKPYEAKIVGTEELTTYLEDGYDVIAVLDGQRMALRRKRA